jgi:hypothetical protein
LGALDEFTKNIYKLQSREFWTRAKKIELRGLAPPAIARHERAGPMGTILFSLK